jgi:exosome complex RNA-binding protein Csl4
MADTEECVTPGQRLGVIDKYDPSLGTYQRGHYIYSALVGYKRVVEFPDDEDRVIIQLTLLSKRAIHVSNLYYRNQF